ncbi:TetR/AcrR family transcriptional regulator C-terminal domain-containing protein [Nocardia sp. BMG111209]|uniref:TetR/AcrR family transcriptional regulator C-terminal domain-containing protein n=1 Tax=Nocardia sp. BMG111209 TaxID=1160137 RepID=UPI00037FD161|nr:TetR/AcrR family transcriptional regulator C-terminal domain-containing protein [Nocardia sp. BMG111209]
MARETLTRGRVLRAALELVDTEGVARLSMRRLGTAVGVEAMSLYNHVSGKRDVLDGVAALVFEEIALPDPALPWPDRLRTLAHGAQASFLAHPVVVGLLAGGQADPRSRGALRFIDAVLGSLLDAGLDDRAAARYYRSLLGLLFGSALARTADVAESPDVSGDSIADWFRDTAAAENLPHLSRVLPALIDADCYPDFGHEIEIFVAGVRAMAALPRS